MRRVLGKACDLAKSMNNIRSDEKEPCGDLLLGQTVHESNGVAVRLQLRFVVSRDALELVGMVDGIDVVRLEVDDVGSDRTVSVEKNNEAVDRSLKEGCPSAYGEGAFS